MRAAARRGVLLAIALAVAACRGNPAEPATPETLATVAEAFDDCVRGDVEGGLHTLDPLVAAAPADADALVARGLCRWARWGDTGDPDDARRAYRDLSDAIEAVQEGARAGTALDQIYSHRAFVAQTLDADWTRALEDLDRAVEINPRSPTHALDRAVARAYARDTLAARADLERYLALADSDDATRQRVAQAMLDDLAPPASDP